MRREVKFSQGRCEGNGSLVGFLPGLCDKGGAEKEVERDAVKGRRESIGGCAAVVVGHQISHVIGAAIGLLCGPAVFLRRTTICSVLDSQQVFLASN